MRRCVSMSISRWLSQSRHLYAFGGRNDGVLPLVPVEAETVHPAVVAGRLRLLVGVGVVLDVQRREEVLVRVGREVGADAAYVLQDRRIGLVEDQLDRGLVDLFRPHAVGPGERELLVDFLVVDDVVGPEGHIIRRERLAVGPFVALAQMEGDFGIIVVPLPARSDVGHDGRHVVRVADHVDLAPGENLGGAGFIGARHTTQRAAVFAAVVIRQHDERILGQPLRHRRQFAVRDLRGEFRTLREGELHAGLFLEFLQLDLLGERGVDSRRFGDRRAARRDYRCRRSGQGQYSARRERHQR